jgi:hypothetical protein
VRRCAGNVGAQRAQPRPRASVCFKHAMRARGRRLLLWSRPARRAARARRAAAHLEAGGLRQAPQLRQGLLYRVPRRVPPHAGGAGAVAVAAAATL